MENDYDNFSEEQFLQQVGRKNSFITPAGYFETLSTHLLNKLEVEKEIKQHQLPGGFDRNLKFTVPRNNFTDLETVLEYKYERHTYTELLKAAKNGLSAPSADYFSDLENKLMNRIELASELNDFKTLSLIEKNNSFLTTPDYFDKNIAIVTAKHAGVKHSGTGIIKHLHTIIFTKKIAIAAGLALIVGVSAVLYFRKDNFSIQTGDCKTLACLEKNELLNDKNIHEFSEENLYEMVDLEELDKIVSEDKIITDSINKNKKE